LAPHDQTVGGLAFGGALAEPAAPDITHPDNMAAIQTFLLTTELFTR
jgi:hypothetical protein